MVFLLILVSATFTAVFLVTNRSMEYNRVVKEVNETDVQRSREEIQVRVGFDDYTPRNHVTLFGTQVGGVVESLSGIDDEYLTVYGYPGTSHVYYPSNYNLLGGTTNVSGSVGNLSKNDGVYMSFRSYYTGTVVDDFVDNDTSDVDLSPDKGAHSNFANQQAGPDSVYDVLTEADTTPFLVKKGTFTKLTSPGTQTVSGVGFTPKAVIFWWTRQTSYGELANVHIGYGFTSYYGGTYQNYGVAFASDDAAATSNAGRHRSATYCIIILSSGTPTMVARASVTEFTSDGFTLNWQTNENRADIIHYIAIGGSILTNAGAGTFSLTTATGTQDVTGVGFQPDFVMFLWTFSESVNTNTANAEIGLGFAISSTKRCAIVANSEDGRDTMDTWQQQRTDSCILILTPSTGAQDAIVDFSTFLTDGFRLNKLDAPAAARPIFYLALQGGLYDVGSFDSPTAAGTQDVTTVGFQPKIVMLATQGRSAGTAIGSHAELAFGSATSSTDRGSTWFEDPDALADSDNEMETLNTKAIQWRDRTAANTFTLRGSADFVSFLSNGFRLNWSNVETSGRQVVYAAFGPPSNYELDLEVQWTSVDYSQVNEVLCIYAGSTGAEDVGVDYWTGSSWSNLFTDLTSNSWNNISVSLTSSTFTVRFKGGSEAGDTTQDTWQIDVTLLHAWSDQYTMEVELTGSSDTDPWTGLSWKLDSAWTVTSVNTTLQLYNYTLGGYPASGYGYVSYLSSETPNTDEIVYQVIPTGPTDFRDSLGNWSMKITGVKNTAAQFDWKCDMAEFAPFIVSTTSMPWWNTDYEYRNQITVTNNVGTTLSSGYSVSLTLDTASLVAEGKMLSNGNDLRVTWWDNSTSTWKELDRDVVDMGTSSTVVWFKTQVDISGLGTDNSYYLHYGNPSAGSPPTDRSKVYYLFDGFDDGALGAAWTVSNIGGASGSASESGTELQITSTSGDIWDTSDNFTYVHTSISGDFSAECYVTSHSPTGLNDWSKLGGVHIRQSTNADSRNRQSSPAYATYGVTNSYRLSDNTTTSESLSGTGDVIPEYLRVTRIGDTSRAFHSDDGKTWTEVGSQITFTQPLTDPILVGIPICTTDGANGWVKVDWFKIRMYVSPEPATSLGAEEMVPKSDWYGIFTVNELASDVDKMEVTYTGHHSLSANLELYIYNFTGGEWYRLGSFNLSIGDVQVGPLTVSANIQNYVNPSKDVWVRVMSRGLNSFYAYSNYLHIKVYPEAGRGYVTVNFINTGSITVQLNHLWVVNGSDHMVLDSTTTPLFQKSLFPGETWTYTFQYSYRWLPPETYTFRVVSEQGNIWSVSATPTS